VVVLVMEETTPFRFLLWLEALIPVRNMQDATLCMKVRILPLDGSFGSIECKTSTFCTQGLERILEKLRK
jgi:hypothetical protein